METLSDDDNVALIARYQSARLAVERELAAPPLQLNAKRDCLESSLSFNNEDNTENAVKDLKPSSDYVMIKGSIQEDMCIRVLELDRTNHQLKAENVLQTREIASLQRKLFAERAARGMSILQRVVELDVSHRLMKAWHGWRLVHARKHGHRQSERQGPASPDVRHEDLLAVVTRLQAENRQLQMELDDRARAAEVLCKRLLRVDATIQSPASPLPKNDSSSRSHRRHSGAGAATSRYQY